jgi:hypothetical protein
MVVALYVRFCDGNPWLRNQLKPSRLVDRAGAADYTPTLPTQSSVLIGTTGNGSRLRCLNPADEALLVVVCPITG